MPQEGVTSGDPTYRMACGDAANAAQSGENEDSLKAERARFVETLNEAAASLERIVTHLAEN